MKRTALSLIFGVALAASSTMASADTAAAGSSGGLISWLLCAMGNQNYCMSLDTTTDPTVVNK